MNQTTWQVIFSGVGGQGLMLAGDLLGAAATEQEGRNAVMTSAYGVETRGTFAKSDVIVSDAEIDFPEVLDADVVIALAPVAYKRYAAELPENVTLLYDASIEALPTAAKQIPLPILKTAQDAGNPNGANVVALGILNGMFNIVAHASIEAAIGNQFKGNERLIKLNLGALHAGIELAKGVQSEGPA